MYKMARNLDGQNRTSQMMEMGEIFHQDTTFLENPSYYYNISVISNDNEREMLPTISLDCIVKGAKIGRNLLTYLIRIH